MGTEYPFGLETAERKVMLLSLEKTVVNKCEERRSLKTQTQLIFLCPHVSCHCFLPLSLTLTEECFHTFLPVNFTPDFYYGRP